MLRVLIDTNVILNYLSERDDKFSKESEHIMLLCAKRDFEDNLQECCAINVGAEYIVTVNIDDFNVSRVKAMTPLEILSIIEEIRRQKSN